MFTASTSRKYYLTVLQTRGRCLLALLMLCACFARGDDTHWVVPAAPGDLRDDIYPLLSPGARRFQQVYEKQEFDSPGLIAGLAFRFRRAPGGSFFFMSRDVEIRLSTTSRAADNLSTNFFENVGSDETVVYSGTRSIFFSPSGVGQFDFSFSFQQPFFFDPTRGHLLVEIRCPSHYSASGYYLSGTRVLGDAVSSLASSAVDGTSGVAFTDGVITRFTVQEPVSILALRHDPAGGTVALTWNSVSNAVYSVSSTAELQWPFTLLTNGVAGTPPVNVFSHPSPESSRFYLIRREQ